MSVLGRALDVVFPPRCAGCGDGTWPFCDGCRARARSAGAAVVRAVRTPLARRGRSVPGLPAFARGLARSPFLYAGPARAAIHRLKFSGWRSVAAALADAMVAAAPPSADAVT